MAAESKQKSKNIVNKEVDADVLYQKLGDQWFAFSLIEDEVFMAPVSENEIQQIRKEYETN